MPLYWWSRQALLSPNCTSAENQTLGLGSAWSAMDHRSFSAARNNAEAFIPRAREIRSMFLREMFVSPRSTAPMKVRCTPQWSANDSCEYPSLFRRRRTAFPSRA